MNPDTTRIMLAIETLSTQPNACVLSIGAFVFSGGSLSAPREFYANVDDPTGHIELDIVKQWFGLSGQNQRAPLLNARPLATALELFSIFCDAHANAEVMEFWTRSPSFEITLAQAYQRMLLPSPFVGHSSRNFPTIESLSAQPFVGRIPGTAHSALEDARAQAIHVLHCMAVLTSHTGPIIESINGDLKR